MPPQRLLSTGHTPDGHERAEVRRVRFLDADVRDARERELACDVAELRLVSGCEDDDVRTARESSWARLAYCVDQLGGLDAALEVTAHDRVVEQGFVRSAAKACPRA